MVFDFFRKEIPVEEIEKLKIQELEEYNKILEEKMAKEYELAKKAREKGLDPELHVEIPQAPDMAARTEGLVGPPDVAQRIREILKEKSREEMVFQLIKEIVDGKFGHFSDRNRLAEQCVRTGLTILTEGVVAASLEGVTKTKIGKNYDNTEYLTIYFAGPIRSAGGTGQAQTVVIGDYVRKLLGLDVYKPTETELERYIEELNLYHDAVAHLQYHPSDEDVKWIVSHCPVCINGESATTLEVSAYRDLERVETNTVRGGMCLVIAEGIAQKAKKVVKFSKVAGLDWSWLESIIKAPKKEDGAHEKKADVYLKDIVGGRPIFAYPEKQGGFRLRYGRGRNSGLNAKGVHPATMYVLDQFAAVATQMKIEKPGKGAACAPNDKILGPVVKLINGDVVEITNIEQAKDMSPQISRILFLGDLLISYGDFLKSNHALLKPGFCEEWWQLIVKEKNLEISGINSKAAVEYSRKFNIPLHPKYTYFYSDLSKEELKMLLLWLSKSEIGVMKTLDGRETKRLAIENSPEKSLLEKICIPHIVREGRIIIEDADAFIETLGIPGSASRTAELNIEEETVLGFISKIAGFPVYDKTGTYIGARMGRPEKAKERLMAPPPHGLVPVGLYGGKIRSIVKAAEKGKISVDTTNYICPKCRKELFSYKCDKCNERGIMLKQCMRCGKISTAEECEACGSKVIAHHKMIVDFGKELKDAAAKYKVAVPDKIKGVIGLMSDEKYFEPVDKALLRAANQIFIFKDGTVRFDCSNLPLLFFKPNEIGLSVEKVKELGYKYDYLGKPITSDTQIIELKPQDMIIPENSAEYMFKTSKFIDQELEKFYGLEKFYNFENKEGLIGQLIIALAPHTSAGVLMRVLGFTKSQANFSHPFAVTARRRDCFHPETTFPIFDGKKWEIVKMGSFIDKLIAEKETEKGYLDDTVIKLDGYSTLSLNKKGNYEIKPIVAFSKHLGSEHLVKLKAKGNKEIITTGTHEFVMPDFEREVPMSAEQVIVPNSVSIPQNDIDSIDLLELDSDYIMVHGIQKQLENKIKEMGGLKKCAESLSLTNKELFCYKKRDSVPLYLLKKLKIEIPENAKIAAKRDDVSLPRFIKIDKDFLHLVGMYISEGYAREGSDCYQVNWCNKRFNKLILSKIKKVFGVSAYESKEQVTLCSRIIYDLFTKLLKAGSGAYTKRIPTLFLNLPLEKLKYILQGYYEGDGGVYKANSVEVHCTSVSKMLLKDIEFALLRYGIQCGWLYDERVCKSGKVFEFNKKKGKILINKSYKLRMYSEDSYNFSRKIGFISSKKSTKLKHLIKNTKIKFLRNKSQILHSEVKQAQIIPNDLPTYNITVADNHNLIASGITSFQCDGDADAIMLLMDALLNFSKKYLPSKIGGKMDAPLVLTTIINPLEVDDQSHDMETVYSYDLDFYDNCVKGVNPGLVKMPLIKHRLGSPNQSVNLGFTHDTTSIDMGPKITQYVKLKTMQEKVEKELELAEKIRAVDEKDVAARIINFHFMRDLYGNLRAFGQQKFRCVDCNSKYRRPPLGGKCSKCGGKLLLTVNRGGIEKYLALSRQMAEKYGLSEYLKQRLDMLQDDIQTIFASEKIKQHSLTDFM